MATPSNTLVRRLAARIRLNATRMVALEGFGYLGQAFSSAELVATLLAGGCLRPGHDRLVLSPGHYVIAIYAAGAELGLLDPGQLSTYGRDGSALEAIGSERTPIVDLVCGSLGQGLSGAVGFALAAHLRGETRDTYALLSDGEMEEGQVWEAAMFAAHHRARMQPLVAVIDANDSQVDGPVGSVTTIEPLAQKWRSFGWRTAEVDGHDVDALSKAFAQRLRGSAPLAIIARTDVRARGRVRSLPETIDGHFIRLDAALTQALIDELERESTVA